MARATLGKEIHCVARDETGLLGRTIYALAQKNIFIVHLAAHTEGDQGHLRLVVSSDDLQKTKESIAYFIPRIEEKEVLLVEFENRTGTLAEVAKVLGQNGISIRSVYGTSSDGFKIIGVFSTADNEKARALINAASGR
ncbi:MAG: ACT domain-containing protein [Candidatus Omnitrophica bacterium]|nr:ACT domain-containing protein [Candidatus Omnitrophota bacterium]